MARRTEDLLLAMHLLAGEDGQDFSSPPVPLLQVENVAKNARRIFYLQWNRPLHGGNRKLRFAAVPISSRKLE